MISLLDLLDLCVVDMSFCTPCLSRSLTWPGLELSSQRRAETSTRASGSCTLELPFAVVNVPALRLNGVLAVLARQIHKRGHYNHQWQFEQRSSSNVKDCATSYTAQHLLLQHNALYPVQLKAQAMQ